MRALERMRAGVHRHARAQHSAVPVRTRIVTAAFLKGLLSGAFAGSPSAPAANIVPVDEEFSAWVRSQGAPEQQECGAEGRGLVALRQLRRGEKLLQLQEQLLLTADVALRESSLSQALQEAQLPEWSVIALYLAELRIQVRSGDLSSRWAPYIQRLSALSPGTVLEWRPAEVDALLRGSPLRRRAQQILDAAEASIIEIEQLLSSVRASAASGGGGGGENRSSNVGGSGGSSYALQITREDLMWAFSMLLSRCIRMDSMQRQMPQPQSPSPSSSSSSSSTLSASPSGGVQALVPFADLLNHDPGVECHLDWDPVSGSLVLTLDRDYKPEHQVYISYGQKTSGELLLSYGFCPPPATNPHEVYYLNVSLEKDTLLDTTTKPTAKASSRGKGAQRQPSSLAAAKQAASTPSDQSPYGPLTPATSFASPAASSSSVTANAAVYEVKVAVLRRRGIAPSQDWPLRLDGLPEGLLGHIALALAQPGSAEEVEVLAATLFDRADGLDGPSGTAEGVAELRMAALRALSAMCSQALKGYPTTMEADKASAESVSTASSSAAASSTVSTTSTSTSSPSSTTSSNAPSAQQRQQQARQGQGKQGQRRQQRQQADTSSPRTPAEASRAAAMAAVRVRERQILQRVEYIANQQLLALKRRGSSSNNDRTAGGMVR